MPLVDRELLLVLESDRDFEVHLVDDNDDPEDLTGATAASLNVRESLSSSVDLLLRRTDAGNLVLDAAGSKLTADGITSAERAAIVPGVYVGFGAVKLAGGEWHHLEPFRVRFARSRAPTF